jgi:hypothetical protein
VARDGALKRLMTGLRREPHDFRASLDVFPALDPQVLAADLKLERIARQRGAANEPPADAPGLDEVETRVVERIEAEKKSSHGILLEQLRTAEERLANLDFEGRFAEIRQAAPAAVSEFRAEAATGRDELTNLRRKLKEHEESKEAFKREHRLTRPPHPPSAGAQALKFGLVALLLLAETVLNGTFLAKGSELGLLGGTTEAFAFALLNVLGSFLFGRLGMPQLVHRGLFHKLLGLVSLVAWLAFALVLNLALAHYREVAGQFLAEGGNAVILRLREDPAGLVDVKSWLFFGIGFFFSVVAFIDGYATVDPYPGFGDVQRRLDAAHEAYIDRKKELVDGLFEVRDEYIATLEDANRDLSVRRAEFDQILSSRQRLVRLFDAHQAHLQQTLNTLLALYRDHNRRARSVPPPARFAETVELVRIAAEAEVPDMTAEAAAIRDRVAEAQKLLVDEVAAIHRAFDEAVEGYRQIDDLVREDGHAKAA